MKKIKLELVVAVTSLVISTISILLTSPFVYSWYTRPKLEFTNSNGFFSFKKEGTILIKNVGKADATNIEVMLGTTSRKPKFQVDEKNNKKMVVTTIDSKITDIILVRPYLAENLSNKVIAIEKPTDNVFFSIEAIPPNKIAAVNYRCDIECSIPAPLIIYSEGKAIEIDESKMKTF